MIILGGPPTVPIYYESRLAKLALAEAERPKIDPDFEEATEGEEVERKEKLKSKWAQLEAVVGAEKRIKLIAEDIVGSIGDQDVVTNPTQDLAFLEGEGQRVEQGDGVGEAGEPDDLQDLHAGRIFMRAGSSRGPPVRRERAGRCGSGR